MKIETFNHNNADKVIDSSNQTQFLKTVESTDFAIYPGCGEKLRKAILTQLRAMGWSNSFVLDVILLSQNETVDPFPIKVEEIKQVWVMRRHVKSRVKKARMYDIEAVKKQLSSGKPQKQGVANPHPFQKVEIGKKKKSSQL
jgi:hypothetical protein